MESDEEPILETCPVCYEDAVAEQQQPHCSCTALCCQTCWRRWIEACESNHVSPTCPNCRTELQEDIVEHVLGRPFERQETLTTAHHEVVDAMDEFTRVWMENRDIRQCDHCGAWIEKTEGCSSMMCLCNYRFCWDCDGAAEDCECYGGTCGSVSYFYDNILQGHVGDFYDTSSRSDEECLEVATQNELVNLKDFLENRLRQVAQDH